MGFRWGKKMKNNRFKERKCETCENKFFGYPNSRYCYDCLTNRQKEKKLKLNNSKGGEK